MDMTDALEDRLREAGRAVTAPPHDSGALVRRALDADLVDIAYTHADSPVGELLLAGSARGLLTVYYLDRHDEDAVLERIAKRVSPRVLEAPARLEETRRQLDDYFEGRRHEFDLPLDWSLVGDFGRRVLGRTAAIPFGEVSSYGEVARDIGSPGAARATGNALGANPMPIVVPCHRVLAAGGALGGYTGGTQRKEALLRIEGVLGRPSRI
jgi:methylated-DNA-[protein]-cysteine S-methyltransferase